MSGFEILPGSVRTMKAPPSGTARELAGGEGAEAKKSLLWRKQPNRAIKLQVCPSDPIEGLHPNLLEAPHAKAGFVRCGWNCLPVHFCPFRSRGLNKDEHRLSSRSFTS